MKFKIGKVEFGSKKTIVIAEAGVNHLGDLSKAEKLVQAAKSGGADIIKFQTYKASKLTTKNAPRFWDWEGERDSKGSQYDSYSILDKFERPQYEALINLCQKYDIEFLSTPFDNEAADMLVDLGIRGFKVASCDITNFPFLEHLAQFHLPILLSTGASSIEEIRAAVDLISAKSNAPVGIMQCTLCYPTDSKDANLRAMLHIAKEFPNNLLGFSDHTFGTTVASASILYGVKYIEKHFTYDKTLPDSADHWLSLDEAELAKLVSELRILEQALSGSGIKEKLDCEDRTHKYARRSIVAAQAIKKGTVLSKENLCCKRPGTGLPPALMERLIGTVASRDIEEDELLQMSDFVELQNV
ncbi:UNVERIFIED_CONTAM: hypothetical protein BEN50_16955 [Euhalothece sp. KZN 001]